MSSPTAATVAELIEELRKLDPTAVVHVSNPPFSGVRVIPQVPSGDILLAAPEVQRRPAAALSSGVRG